MIWKTSIRLRAPTTLAVAKIALTLFSGDHFHIHADLVVIDADHADLVGDLGDDHDTSAVCRWVEERPSLRVVVAFRKPYAGPQLTLCRSTIELMQVHPVTQHIDLLYL